MNDNLKFILIFIYCFLLQILVLENVQGLFWFHPFIYLFFLLYYPPEMPKWASVLLAFFTGFVFDIFLNSYGVHASASLVVGLLKPFLAAGNINNAPAREDEKGSWLNRGKKTFKFYFILLFVSVHHLMVFLLEMPGQNFFKITLPTWIGSTICTVLLILISEELFFKTFRQKK